MHTEMNFDKDFELLFNRALVLKNEDKPLEALEIFEKLALQHDYFMTFMMMGDIYWEMEKQNEAEKHFKKAVRLKPDSEKASIAYFHILWEQQKKEEALEEIKRFTSKHDSDTYLQILDEINSGE